MDDPQQQTQQTDPYVAIAQPLPKGAPDSSQADPYATIATPVAPDDKPDEQQPGFWSRAYETSGIKGLVDTAKARADADRQAAEEITGHIKNGRWGHALEGIVGHLGKQAASAALGPAGDIIKGNVENTYQKGKQAVQDVGKGDYAGAVADAAEAVPVVGPVAGAIAEPAAKDIKDKNWAGVAGDVVGGAGQLLSMKGLGSEAEPVAEPVAGAPLTVGEESGPGFRQSGEKLLSRTGTAENRMRDVMDQRTQAMTTAVDKISPKAPTPEVAGTKIQDAARDVLDRQNQAQTLVGDLADRAQTTADDTRASATERAGTGAQDAATRQLNARRVSDIQAGKSTAKALSGVDELPVPETDREIISALRNANSDAKVEESAAHNELAENAKAKGIEVDPSPMRDVAKEVVSLEGPAKDLVMSSLPATVYRTLEKVAGDAPSESDILASRAKDFGWNPEKLSEQQMRAIQQDLKEYPPAGMDTSHVPYQTMKTARTAVGESLQAARKHFQQTGMGNNAVRTLQSLYGSMTDAMKASLADDPELAAQFEKANALTRDRASTFVDPKTIRKMVYADDPGKVIGSVMRSGSDADVSALRSALEADKTGQGLARAQRGGMDYVLRKSGKAATSDLPAGVTPEAIDYDLATRNAKSSTALRTLLGDDKYDNFVAELDAKRLAQRAPSEINLDNQLTKIAKADTPEKAAKLAGYDASTDASVQAADRRASTAANARDRMRTPSIAQKGTQQVAERVAGDLEPSKIVEHAATSPEYTDKILSVLDKHPDAGNLRQALGQRIFRNASDNSMVQGAFGSSDGVFDVSKFQSEYAKTRPSLEKILPKDNLTAMDDFNQSLNRYALSKGIGGGGGMGGRFLAIRQIMGLFGMVKGLASLSPATFTTGATIAFGPRIWMELATRPALTRGVSVAIKKSLATGALAPKQQDKPQGVPEGRIPVQAPDGTTYHFPDEESANRFKQAANIQ